MSDSKPTPDIHVTFTDTPHGTPDTVSVSVGEEILHDAEDETSTLETLREVDPDDAIDKALTLIAIAPAFDSIQEDEVAAANITRVEYENLW